MKKYHNTSGELEKLAVLSGNSYLNPNINYLGFDGEQVDLDFIDQPDEFSSAIGRKRKRRRKSGGGGFNRFLEGIGISPKASQERRDLKQRKQASVEQEQRHGRQSEKENVQLQKQALVAASKDDGSSADLQKLMATQAVIPTAAPSATSKMKKGTKIALIVGGAVLLAGITFAVIKYSKNK